MKRETLATLNRGAEIDEKELGESIAYLAPLLRGELAGYGWATSRVLAAARAYLAHTCRHVEQPAETEEQALSELRAWVNVDGKLRAATLSNVGVKLKDYREDREWFVVEGRNDPAAIREALRLAKETQ